MEQPAAKKGVPVEKWVISALAAVTLALVLHLFGTALGRSLLQMQQDYRLEMFARITQQQGLVSKMITDEEARTAMNKYIGALADATIRFEFFPQKDDAENFLEILSVLPSKVKIERFAFTGHDLTVTCSASLSESLVQFAKALDSIPNFKSAKPEFFPRADGGTLAVIVCTAL